MKPTGMMALAVLIVASGLALHEARAQQPALNRIDLQRHDLSIPGREAVQVIVEIAPGMASPKHTHPGEEVIYVLEGSLEYQVEGKPPVTLKAGRLVHSRRNDPPGEECRHRTWGRKLATYIVEKGKPLLTVVE